MECLHHFRGVEVLSFQFFPNFLHSRIGSGLVGHVTNNRNTYKIGGVAFHIYHGYVQAGQARLLTSSIIL